MGRPALGRIADAVRAAWAPSIAADCRQDWRAGFEVGTRSRASEEGDSTAVEPSMISASTSKPDPQLTGTSISKG
ncbi:hypothetical protein JNB63_10535 [Microbacterium trichothecenolyticum]|uniref:hypothetical protein n=1 Tax=Microbacterium trichothecenolyticum TaxID=69370 RepID=UPI001C6E618F|nr:hypothetical protein [Microbacterium trichothecenolyticum]MBW9120534.1 hypothetical protein [Microbacterium trichothecenolyticum]